MLRHLICVFSVLGLALLSATPSSVLAADNSYIEDFTSKQFCDTTATTAWWDTAAAELKLYPFELAHVGSIDTPGLAYGVALAGDQAYVADADGHLKVFNIADPANPSFVATLHTLDTARDVVVAGDHAYVADGTQGLCVIYIGTIGFGHSENTDTPGTAEDVFVAGDLAYIADGDSGLRVLDVETLPAAYVGNVPTLDYAWGLDVRGDYAYVAVDDSGLVVVDISDPSSPQVVGHHDTPYWAFNVAVSGNYAFVADYGSGLQVFDVSQPNAPSLVGSYNTDGMAVDVKIVGDNAYVADGYSGLAVIDITDPADPGFVGKCVVNGLCWDVAVAGEHAYLAAYDYGLQVIDICDRLVNLAEMGSGKTPGNSTDVAVDGNYAYVADWYKGVRVVDISDPGSPVVMGSFDLGTFFAGRAFHVAVAGSYAYVAYDDSGVVVVDVSDPMDPTWAGNYVTGGEAHDLAIEGDYLYIGDGSAYFQVADISDPTNPTYVGSYNPGPGAVGGIAVDGNIAIAVDNIMSEMVMIDITDPTSPVRGGSFTLSEPLEVVIQGDYAYVADYDLGILAFSLTDPGGPVFLDSIRTSGYPYDIEVDGDYAVVADQDAGVTILDISDPSDLVILESLDIGICHGLTMAGDYIFAADQHPGLAVIKMYDRYFDIHRNMGHSLAFYEGSDPALKVRVTTSQTSWVGWWVTGDSAGTYWTYVEPGGGWYWVSAPGTTMQWASIHVPLYAGVNPSCSELKIEWLYEHALIDSVVDIPGDQGGRVRIYFTRSGWDFGEGEYPIISYNLWRRVDNPALTAALEPLRLSTAPAIDHHLGLPLLGHEGRSYFIQDGNVVGSGFPPGTWEVLGGFAAVQQDQYIQAAETLADSTIAGVSYTVYCISAHTALPSLWYVSPPDSGYSIDNMAPAPPPNFRMESENELAWDMVPDDDFQYYSVYGTASPDFEEDRVLIGYTIGLGMELSAGDIFNYYHVTASDYAGNEGYPSTVENAFAGLPEKEDLPHAFSLGPSRPNPFSEATVIRFDLPEPCQVSLSVYDTGGRLVAVLADGEYPAGRHSIVWSIGDHVDGGLAPGVYFLSMRAPGFSAVEKMLLLR